MFARLMPREGKYFDLFNAHADLIAQGGKALSNMIAALVDHPEQAPAFAEEIDNLERAADAITHDTLSQLHTAFITPFDRDEIHQLINAKAMAIVTENCCICVQSVIKLMHSMDNAPAILKFCHEIDALETEADRSLRAAMSKIFREEPDVREVIKLKEIYELFETVTDRCKDVAGTIEAIVLENS